MNKIIITAIASAVALTFSAVSIAQTISEDEYKSEKDKISVEYKSSKEKCSSLAGNFKDICHAEVKGGESVAKAELENKYKPTPKKPI